MKIIGRFAILFLVIAVHAQPRGADKLYIPVAANINNGAAQYVTNLFVSNVSKNPGPNALSVSFTYVDGGRTDSDPHFPLPIKRPDFLRLATTDKGYPIPNVLARLGIVGTGMLVLDAFRIPDRLCSELGYMYAANVCRYADEMAHKHDPLLNDESASITVAVEVTTTLNGETRTHLQTEKAIPWFAVASSDYAYFGHNKVMVGMVREVGNDEFGKDIKGYHSTIGVGNASEFSETTFIITLFDGLGVQRGQIQIPNVCPLCSYQVKVIDWFPVFELNRANRLPPIDSPYFIVEQINSKKVAEGCYEPDGICPAFIAWGVVTDSRSGDSDFHESEWLVADQSRLASAGKALKEMATHRRMEKE